MYNELANIDKNQFIFFTTVYHGIIEGAIKDEATGGVFSTLNTEQKNEAINTYLFSTLNQLTDGAWKEDDIELALIILSSIKDAVKFEKTFVEAKLICGGWSTKTKHVIVNTTESTFKLPLDQKFEIKGGF